PFLVYQIHPIRFVGLAARGFWQLYNSVKAKDLIACEGETAKPTCAKGTIKVLSANYGRTDKTACSTGRPANQLSNVQCRQSTSLSVVAKQCDGKQDCSIPATNKVFSDPCVGTYKYLNVSYTCSQGKTVIICQDKSSDISCGTCKTSNITHIHKNAVAILFHYYFYLKLL
ncbi:putative L-rhamnose-binding lectin CSL2, partial [Triplophysa rosa]